MKHIRLFNYSRSIVMVLLMASIGFGLFACGGGGGGSESGESDDGQYDPVASDAKSITGFSFTSPFAAGVINEDTHAIFVTVPFDTDATALVPTILHSGESIRPVSEEAQDYSRPVTYTVTACDGSTRDYTVTVIIDADPDGSNYYVSNSGDDDRNDGRTPDTPWKTISKVNSMSFEPGDAILFKRGDTWRDGPLRVTSSGDSGAQITYGAYGDGGRPKIYGSVRAEGWDRVSGYIWQSSATIPLNPWSIGYNNEGPPLFFEETDGSTTWGAYRSFSESFTNLNAEYEWTWNSDRVYVYSPSDPGTRYASVEATQMVRGIMLQDHNYISITGLEIKYYADQGIYDNYDTNRLYGLQVTHCEIAYIGRKNDSAGYGMSVHQSDAYYAYNDIHDCGRRGISLTMYGETNPIIQSNVIIEYNHFHHGWHTTSLDGCAAGRHVLENVIFRYNQVDGDENVDLREAQHPNANHIYCDFEGTGSGSVNDFFFHNNIFTYAHASSIKIADVSNFQIYNNTFYKFNPTLSNWQAHVYTSTSRGPVIIKNNIFVNNAGDHPDMGTDPEISLNQWAAIKLTEGYQDFVDTDHNLYFQSSEGQRFYWVAGGTSYAVEDWDAYKEATGFDANSPAPADPDFADPPVDFSLGDGSPAIGAGVAVAGVTTDFYGNALNTPPDLGAVQR